jgi:hypothetical protein
VRPPAGRPGLHKVSRSWPAAHFVGLYVAVLLLVPAGLIVHALGAAGTPATIVGLCLLVWWICGTLGGFNPAYRRSPIHLGIGLLAVSCVLSYASGTASGWSRPANIRQVTDDLWTLLPITVADLHAKSELAGLRGLISIAGWVGITLMLSDGIRSWKEFDRLISWICWLAALLGVLALIQFATGDNLAKYINIPGLSPNAEIGAAIRRSDFNRVSVTATHPIEFGVVIASLFPLTLHHALYHAKHRRDLIPVTLVAIATPMSVSRSAILVIGTAALVMFAGWSFNRRAWAIVIAPVVALAMRAVFPGLLGTIRGLFTSALNDPSVTGRTSDYNLVLGIYAEHPWLGRGPFTFMPRYYRTLDNQYLMNLLELGAVGLAVILVLVFAAVYAARYVNRHGQTEQHQHIGLALSAAVTGMFLSYATFDAWGFPMATGTTFLLVGLIGAAWQLTRRDTLERTRTENP